MKFLHLKNPLKNISAWSSRFFILYQLFSHMSYSISHTLYQLTHFIQPSLTTISSLTHFLFLLFLYLLVFFFVSIFSIYFFYPFFFFFFIFFPFPSLYTFLFSPQLTPPYHSQGRTYIESREGTGRHSNLKTNKFYIFHHMCPFSNELYASPNEQIHGNSSLFLMYAPSQFLF